MRGASLTLAVVALTAACGGAAHRNLSGVDANRLVTIRPDTPGWGWSALSGSTVRFERNDPGSSDVSLGDAAARWQDSAKLAHIDVSVFATESEAHAALPTFRPFAHKWAVRDSGAFTDRTLDGVGDHAWRIREGPADFGETSTLGWQRGNLVLEVHIQCIFTSCRSDIGKAVRRWAEAVDSAVR